MNVKISKDKDLRSVQEYPVNVDAYIMLELRFFRYISKECKVDLSLREDVNMMSAHTFLSHEIYKYNYNIYI